MSNTVKNKIKIIFTVFILVGCSNRGFTQNDELDNERAIAEQQRQVVENLTKQIESEQQRARDQIPYQIEVQNSQINSATTQMSELRNAQNVLNSDISEAIAREKIEADSQKDQISSLIHALEQNIPHSEEQITILLGISYRTKEQEARLSELRSSVEAQKQQLSYLQSQLAALNAGSIARMNIMFSQAQDQKRELASYSEEVQNQMEQSRATIAELQSQSIQSRMSLMRLNQQLKTAEKNYKEQLEKVKSIEARTGTNTQ
jgi:chromosome segregation ATPase